MSAFKVHSGLTDGAWRKNEPNGTAKYFNCRLSSIMDAQDIRPTQLAAFLGVSPSIITLWRKGTEIPPSDKQEIIALYLGCKHRAEIWVFRSKDLYDKIARLNILYKQMAGIEAEIKEELNQHD